MNKINLMKQRMIYLMLVLMAVSCSSPSSQQTTESADTIQTATDSVSMSEVDGVSGATNVANPPSFNGIIMMPPQNHVTVTLGMGGSVRDIRVLPGEYVRKGEVILTLPIRLSSNFSNLTLMLLPRPSI